MLPHTSLRRRLLVTACAATRTTNLVARRTGVAPFLPALFPLRYANMGGLDQALFAQQLQAIRSFDDEAWCGHWDAIATDHLVRAQDRLDRLSAAEAPRLASMLDGPHAAAADALAELLAAGTPVLADHGPQPAPAAIERLAIQEAARGGVAPARVADAAVALDEIVKAVTYFQVSAFPGTSDRRMASYWRSRRLFDALRPAFSEGLGLTIEPLDLETGGETVGGLLVVPGDDVDGPRPAVLVTNGLEGTYQELVIPLMRHRSSGLAVVAMEMPGTYAYRQPMTAASEEIYDRVLERIAADPRIDAERIGMVGVSFGGYWSTRLAAHSSALKAAVSCGAPTHHSFGLSLGMPEIILHAMAEVVGASNPIALLRAVRRLDLADLYAQIKIPLLVINGDDDTLLSTQDSVDLANGAPRGELKLYPGDDHCAMGHYHEWLELSQRWLVEQLGAAPGRAGVSDG